MAQQLLQSPNKRKQKRAVRILKTLGVILAVAIFSALTLNSLLCIFSDGYYPTFGGYRLFAIVSDSMEPTIPTGNMIVGRVPSSADEIRVGDVITFEVRSGGSTALVTHRVTEVRVGDNGAVSYTTKGDNAPRADTVHPSYSDVVGVFTGKKCGFFGYFFGFLQSPEGAIALIIAAFIIIITLIITRFVNLVTVWRKVALGALQKSGTILSKTNDDGLGTLADVIGIVSKEPTDKTDLRRKDKKLKWFIRTGSLPKRPYSDDIDENAESIALAAQSDDEVAAADATELLPQTATVTEGQSGELIATKTTRTVRERYETVRYDYTYTARLVRLKPEAKDWYCAIKNELLSFERVRSRTGKRCETFFAGRTAIARLAVRGKTLTVKLSEDALQYADGKPWLKRTGAKSTTPCVCRVTSARRAKYVTELISRTLSARLTKNKDYEPRDFYMPYEGVMSLMSKGLVKRKLGHGEKLFRVTEIVGEE